MNLLGEYHTRDFELTSHGAPYSVPSTVPDAFQVGFQYRSTLSDAADGSGRVTVLFDGKEQTVTLTPEQRRIGATFDRFGIFNSQTGGHYVDIALDDLRFTKGR